MNRDANPRKGDSRAEAANAAASDEDGKRAGQGLRPFTQAVLRVSSTWRQ
jgi:hypothetical protein